MVLYWTSKKVYEPTFCINIVEIKSRNNNVD